MEVGPVEFRPIKVCLAEVSPIEVHTCEVRPSEVRPAEVRLGEVCREEERVTEVHPAEARLAEVRLGEESPTEIRPTKVWSNIFISFSPLVPDFSTFLDYCEMFFVGHCLPFPGCFDATLPYLTVDSRHPSFGVIAGK